MPQFDVFRVPGSRTYPLVVDLQAGLLRDLATRVVAPLVARRGLDGKPITRLNPVVSIAGKEYVVLFQEMSAVPLTALGSSVGNLGDRRVDLVAALDLLFTGV